MWRSRRPPILLWLQLGIVTSGKSGCLLIVKDDFEVTVLLNERTIMKILMKTLRSNRTVSGGLFLAAVMTAALTVQAQQTPGNKAPERNQPGQANQGNEDRSKDSDTADRSGNKDHMFIKESLQCNLLETRLGNLTQQKGQNSEVKQFGQRLIQDHGQAYNQIKQIAQKEGIQSTQQLDQKHQALYDQLQSKTGEEFDKEFSKLMVKGHVKEVAKFEKASRECQNEDLKTYAQQTLPTLRQHLQEAKQLARSVGIDDATIATLTREGEDAAGGPAAGAEVGREAGEKKQGERINTPKDTPNRPNDPGQPDQPKP
jgi:putative membrane protein